MKFIKFITKIWEFFTIKVPLSLRIILCVVLAGGIASTIILSLINPHEGYKYLVLEVAIKRTSTGDNHTLDNTDDFYLENDHAKQNVDRYYGYTSFNSIKPVNDYSWIGMKINDIREYDFTLLFEVPSTFNFEEQLSFLEVDFFIGKNADSILIR